MENILLTPFDLAPFSKIKTTDYEPAFERAIANAKDEIQQIIDQAETADFENTIEAMAFSGMQLDRISNIFFNLNSAETNDELQNIAQIVAPKLSAFANDISLNPDLFARVKQVQDRKSTRLNSSHVRISYAVFCLKKKKKTKNTNL